MKSASYKPLVLLFGYSFPTSAIFAQVLSRCFLFLFCRVIADGGGEEP